MPALPSAASATLPVMPVREDVDEHQVIVGAAAHEPEAGVCEDTGQARRVGDDLPLVVRERRFRALL